MYNIPLKQNCLYANECRSLNALYSYMLFSHFLLNLTFDVIYMFADLRYILKDNFSLIGYAHFNIAKIAHVFYDIQHGSVGIHILFVADRIIYISLYLIINLNVTNNFHVCVSQFEDNSTVVLEKKKNSRL